MKDTPEHRWIADGMAADRNGTYGYRCEICKMTRRFSVQAVQDAVWKAPCPGTSESSRKDTGPEVPVVRDYLTPRQVEIARYVGSGKSNDEIGKALKISPDTVKFHINEMFKTLNVHRRTSIAIAALKRGDITLEELET